MTENPVLLPKTEDHPKLPAPSITNASISETNIFKAEKSLTTDTFLGSIELDKKTFFI